MRNGKIARIPWKIREELNRRLQNAELAAPILEWLNSLPDVQQILSTLFDGKRVTRQNLTEWRYGGYQEWLRHQSRQESIQRVVEQGYELEQRDGGEDIFEAFCRILIAELSTRIETLHTIRDPAKRLAQLQKITRDFVSLQTSSNWSSHVRLEWVKYHDQFEPEEEKPPLDPPNPGEPEPLPLTAPKLSENAECKPSQTQANQGEDAHPTLSVAAQSKNEPAEEQSDATGSTPNASSSQLSDPPPPPRLVSSEPRADGSLSEGASTPNTNSPQLSEAAPALDIGLRTLDKDPFQAIPASSPTTPINIRPAAKKPAYKTPRPPIRGRRFICVEG